MSLEQAYSPPDFPASVVAIKNSISVRLSLRDLALPVKGLWIPRRAQLNGRGLHATIQRRRRESKIAQSVDVHILLAVNEISINTRTAITTPFDSHVPQINRC